MKMLYMPNYPSRTVSRMDETDFALMTNSEFDFLWHYLWRRNKGGKDQTKRICEKGGIQ